LVVHVEEHQHHFSTARSLAGLPKHRATQIRRIQRIFLYLWSQPAGWFFFFFCIAAAGPADGQQLTKHIAAAPDEPGRAAMRQTNPAHTGGMPFRSAIL